MLADAQHTLKLHPEVRPLNDTYVYVKHESSRLLQQAYGTVHERPTNKAVGTNSVRRLETRMHAEKRATQERKTATCRDHAGPCDTHTRHRIHGS